ncbi:G-protein coupled receptors family 1 profile domain-containing protein [Caenorhabditis elegans]|uniref:G-protein coupled receptors family 1 profile domain-containing protein n=1 Tax=Caenorhabditis elegans TaxID=6239 RepID=O17615_CAEEL|nr:G-protein coupled receptors family 1 profile domain-containing protein [Caenorhabditis elegans]CAB02802.3 G-protein coupled receptors family 1 profile domain-containing protein [Caenorhabditis elegans]|eukprot:NP_506809.3 Serpentine Receptor, class X [Caenorhabditis elegans]
MDFLDVFLFQENVFIFGFLVAVFHDVSVLTHFIISLNRFISVWCPIFYKTMFNLKYTKLFIFAVWLISFLIGSLFHIVLCRIRFNADLILFTIILAPSYCFEIGRYGDLFRNSCIVIIMMILDVFTLIKVKLISNEIKKSVSEQAVQQFTSRDRRFLAQAVTQGSLFLLATMVFFPTRFSVNSWVTFLGGNSCGRWTHHDSLQPGNKKTYM